MRNAHLVALFLATFPPFLSVRGADYPSNLAPNWSGTLQENNVVDTVNTQKNEGYTSKEASTTSPSSRKHHLGTAHVVGHSTVHQLKYAPQIVSLVGERQLQGTASSLNEVLNRVAGVTIRSTGGVGSPSRISVRGLEGKRMGLFVDEAAIGQFSNFVNLDDIPTDMIERVEIYKGIVPYRLGGDALGGAVNVVVKDYPPRYLDASYEYGSFNTHRFNSVFKRHDAKTGLEWGAGGLYVHSDNDYEMTLHHQGDIRVRRNHDAFTKAVAGGSLKATKWWFDELKLEAIATLTRQELQGIELDYQHAFNHARSILGSVTAKRQNFFVKGLDFDLSAAVNVGSYGQVDTAHVVHGWDGTTRRSQSPYGGETMNFPSDSHNSTLNWVSKLNMNYELSENHLVNLNVYGSGTALHPENAVMDRALGYRVGYDSRLNSITTGLSYDAFFFNRRLQTALTLKNFYINSRGQHLENYFLNQLKPIYIDRVEWGANFAVAYRPIQEWLFKAAVSSEVRIPSSEELIGNGYTIVPSPELKPERNNSLNLGVLYHKNLERGGMFEAELNVFASQLTDMIRFTPGMIPSTARYANFGAVNSRGIEGEVKGDFTPWLYAYVNATWQDLRDVRQFIPETKVPNPSYEKRIPNVPYLMANGGLELHGKNWFGGKGQNTRILLDASYIHQYFYDFELSRFQDRKIPTSLTCDAAIEHSFDNNRWTLTFKLRNLTNREVVSEFNRPLPGRNFSIKLRYLFR
jgi:putative mxcH protein